MAALPLTSQIKKAILLSGKSFHKIAIDAGISPPQMYRFMDGKRGLSLENLDKVAAALDLRIVMDDKKKEAI